MHSIIEYILHKSLSFVKKSGLHYLYSGRISGSVKRCCTFVVQYIDIQTFRQQGLYTKDKIIKK